MIKEILKTSSKGDILRFQEEISNAIEKGATNYNCHIAYTSGNTAYVQMIEFTRHLSDKEVLSNKKEVLLKEIKELNEEINKLNK